MGKSGKFLAGALLGAAAAALLTPVAGKKARKKVAEGLEKAGVDREMVEETLRAAAKKGSDLLKQARKEVAASKTKTKSK
ncbi:MAG: YtxH domain-containing protein [Parcubacteria group bacterium]|nr:YtxH domain-containing protein [Parcubacteria group bacterium]